MISIRTATEDDAEELLAIYAPYVKQTAITFEYDVPSKKEFKSRIKDSVYFHERLGYHMVGTFHQCGYKFGRWYDMVWMEKFIGEHTKNQAPVILYKDI